MVKPPKPITKARGKAKTGKKMATTKRRHLVVARKKKKK
jgi:hypothetical protein